MADMYTGLRPWEMIQGGFGQLSQTGEHAYQNKLALDARAQEQARLNAPIDPTLAEYYRKAFEALNGQPAAPQMDMPQLGIAPMPSIRGLNSPGPQPQQTPVVAPLPEGPADGAAPPAAPKGSLGSVPQRESIVDMLTRDDSDIPTAAPESALTAPPRPRPAPAPAAPAPARPTQASTSSSLVSADPDAPVALRSPVPGKAPWMISNRDLPALQALLPVVQEHLRQTGLNQRTSLTQGTRAAIAELKLTTGNEQLAAKLEVDLAKNEAKLTNAQQIAVIKQVSDLDRSFKQFQANWHKADQAVKAAQLAADARVSDSMNRSDATIQASKNAADARKYAARAGIASATESARIRGTAQLGAAELAKEGKMYAADKNAENVKLRLETALKSKKDLPLEYTKQLMRMASNEMLLATPAGREAFQNAVNHVNSIMAENGEKPFEWDLVSPTE